MSTQVVLVNWRRPENVAIILDALHKQTVPFDKIVLVDNGAQDGYAVSKEALKLVTDHWIFPDSGLGPPCRFAPALIDYRPKYTLFIDDDMLPGPKAHAHLISTAARLNDNFATIGEIGRIYEHDDATDQLIYKVRDVNRKLTAPTIVHLTCRAHFVKTIDVKHAIWLRDELLRTTGQPPAGEDDWTRHDDILLCHGIQERARKYSFLTTKQIDQEINLVLAKLPDHHAMSHRAGHVPSRQLLINKCSERGYLTAFRGAEYV
jgi:glycosyltransferase involved in cell wall biosynthesis